MQIAGASSNKACSRREARLRQVLVIGSMPYKISMYSVARLEKNLSSFDCWFKSNWDHMKSVLKANPSWSRPGFAWEVRGASSLARAGC